MARTRSGVSLTIWLRANIAWRAIESAVISTGLNRRMAPVRAASKTSMPSSRNWFM